MWRAAGVLRRNSATPAPAAVPSVDRFGLRKGVSGLAVPTSAGGATLLAPPEFRDERLSDVARVLAEGPETEEHVRYLCEHGCDLAQGFYFSKPVPLDELLVLLDGGPLPLPD